MSRSAKCEGADDLRIRGCNRRRRGLSPGVSTHEKEIVDFKSNFESQCKKCDVIVCFRVVDSRSDTWTIVSAGRAATGDLEIE